MNNKRVEELKKELLRTLKIVTENDKTKREKIIASKAVDDIFAEYEKIKIHLKAFISEDDFLLDRHKIAASFLLATYNIKPIVFNDIDDRELTKHQLAYINFTAGYYFARTIIKSFSGVKIKEPKTSNRKDYFDNLFALFYLILANESKDKMTISKESVLTLSHILFLLEVNSI
ncbi:MAG: hypothetical protein ACLFOC_05980 [Campylobacterales bacterium]